MIWSTGWLCETWLYWGMFWLMITPSIGVALSGTFNYPDYLRSTIQLTFGGCGRSCERRDLRRPSRPFSIGLCYYLVPRPLRRSRRGGTMGRTARVVWSLVLAAGLISLPFGEIMDFEAGELPLFAEIPLILRRGDRDRQFYSRLAALERRSMSRSGI